MQTTRQLRNEIGRLNRLIARIEAKAQHESPLWATALGELRDEREMLTLVMLNRGVEGSKKVVSFRRWRDGPWAPAQFAHAAAGRR
ncbi:MAG TPA: hypothetical protein VLV50_20495 [Stellaceae bacterium]|nr:hypothetical protein [Stellaceae bacterium]